MLLSIRARRPLHPQTEKGAFQFRDARAKRKGSFFNRTNRTSSTSDICNRPEEESFA